MAYFLAICHCFLVDFASSFVVDNVIDSIRDLQKDPSQRMLIQIALLLCFLLPYPSKGLYSWPSLQHIISVIYFLKRTAPRGTSHPSRNARHFSFLRTVQSSCTHISVCYHVLLPDIREPSSQLLPYYPLVFQTVRCVTTFYCLEFRYCRVSYFALPFDFSHSQVSYNLLRTDFWYI